MEVKNIIKKLNKNGVTKYDIIPMQAGCDAIRIQYRYAYDLSNIIGLFKRGVKIEIDTYTKTLTLWNIKEWNRARTLYDNMNILVNIFYEELRKGKTPAEAKQIQYEYAKENNMIAAFYMIYE